MRGVARVEHVGNMLHVRLPYNERLVRSFQEDVPWRARWWLSTERCWRVRPIYMPTIRQLCEDYGVELVEVANAPTD